MGSRKVPRTATRRATHLVRQTGPRMVHWRGPSWDCCLGLPRDSSWASRMGNRWDCCSGPRTATQMG